jgi:Spy/CpxP family protein refolding chaperone
MNRFQGTVAGVLIAGVLAGGMAAAQGPRGGGPGGPGRGARFDTPGLALRQLNLTDAQEQQIRMIRERELDALRQAQDAVGKALDAQTGAVQTVPINEGLIRQTTQALADAQTEAALQRARVYNEMWTVLTPAQQTQAKKLQAEREVRHNTRRQERQGR